MSDNKCMAQYKVLGTESDSKTKKGSLLGWLTAILYFAPAKEADGIHDMCPMRSDQCTMACLNGSGLAGVFPSIKRARVQKTLWYLRDRIGFMNALRKDLWKLIAAAAAREMKPACRLNGTSDQPQLAMQMAREFPMIQFYDYTKIPAPWKRTLSNYHLTFSFSGDNLKDCMEALAHGINVAVVFPTANFPTTWHGFPVVNGDANDSRFLDPKNVVVGLKAKGDAKKLEVGGFVQSGLIQISGGVN